MNIFKFLWSDLKLGYLEIRNYFYVWSIIKKHQYSIEWSYKKLRCDWLGRIYTVLNITNRDLEIGGTETNLYQLELLKSMVQLVDDYIQKIFGDDCGDFLTTKIQQINDTYSWLLVYHSKFNKLSFTFFVRWLLIFLGLVFVVSWLV